MNSFINKLSSILAIIDEFVWGPAMLTLLVGTGIFLTVKTRALCWRNLPYALKSVLSKEARIKTGDGDVSPFSALMTALASTIGTGNIVGVATAMISGGPGALIWMWVSAAFGLTSKFSECMLSLKYREVNDKGEMSGGPMYTMKNGFKHKKVGLVLASLFALFTIFASFGIGNLTQANSISSSLNASFHIPNWITGVSLSVIALLVILGGIKAISKVSQIVVPFMAVIYIIAGLIIIIGNFSNVPSGVAIIFKMAFSVEAMGGGLAGTITASMMQAMRFGIARGVFSNEAGMGSAAIAAAASTCDDPVKQGYINMTGTFWDTIVVCTITGLCIASSGVLGTTTLKSSGTFDYVNANTISVVATDIDDSEDNDTYELSDFTIREVTPEYTLYVDSMKDEHYLYNNGNYECKTLVTGAALTIAAFGTVLGDFAGWIISFCLTLFAFSTILGWEYNGEKAFEFLAKSSRFVVIYRVIFSLFIFIGATASISLVWSFSDIANALMAIPNLITLIALSGVIKAELQRYHDIHVK